MRRRILFVWPVYGGVPGINNGISAMAGSLKAHGFKVKLFMPSKDQDLSTEIKRFDPDVIGFSCNVLQRRHILDWGKFFRSYFYDAKIVVGGPDVILNPKYYAELSFVDYVCLGEGDTAIVDLMKGQPSNNIVSSSEIRDDSDFRIELVDLSKLEPEDFSIYNWDAIMIERHGWLGEFFIGRGCPYSCTYCSNIRIREAWHVCPKDYVRFKSIENVIREIRWGISNYTGSDVPVIVFGDDTFTVSYAHMIEFLPTYAKEIGFPFVCNINPLAFDEKKAEVLRKYGCFQVKMGLETGIDQLRNQILGRKEKTADIEKAFSIARDANLQVSVFIMLGIPGETLDTLNETLLLLGKLKPDRFKMSIFYPFSGTQLYDYCVENDLIDFSKLGQQDNWTEDTVLRFSEPIRARIAEIIQDVGAAVNQVCGQDIYKTAFGNFGMKKLE